jgi:hypothetical protein
MTGQYLRLKEVHKLFIRDDYSEVWVKGEDYWYEDSYEVIEGLDYFKNEYKRVQAAEDMRRKTAKMASMKATAIKMQ